MSDLRELIAQAVQLGVPIVIAYNGGSRPGQERAVIPISVSADELVARELSQAQSKTFKLAKIASFRLADGLTTANPLAEPPPVAVVPELATFNEYVQVFAGLASRGQWHVISGENRFSVCGFFKNGKPRKSPEVSIQFVDRSSDTVVDIITGEVLEEHYEPTGRERPWRVDSKRMGDGKSFALLHRAAELFIMELTAAEGGWK